MRASTDHILTSHAGSLPRPDVLIEAWGKSDEGALTQTLTAAFGPNSVLDLTPDLVGPWITKNRGIIGEGVELTLAHIATCGLRRSCFISLGGCCSRSSAIRARTRGSTSSAN